MHQPYHTFVPVLTRRGGEVRSSQIRSIPWLQLAKFFLVYLVARSGRPTDRHHNLLSRLYFRPTHPKALPTTALVNWWDTMKNTRHRNVLGFHLNFSNSVSVMSYWLHLISCCFTSERHHERHHDNSRMSALSELSFYKLCRCYLEGKNLPCTVQTVERNVMKSIPSRDRKCPVLNA
jgi:hypothetical protein